MKDVLSIISFLESEIKFYENQRNGSVIAEYNKKLLHVIMNSEDNSVGEDDIEEMRRRA